MNVHFQICGLAILILLFIFYKSHKTLQLYKEKVFYRAMCVMIISLTLDVVSLSVIYFRNLIPLMLVDFICKTYIVSLIWGARMALVYVLTDMFPQKKHQRVSNFLLGIILIQSMIIYGLPIYIYEQGSIVYTYGPSVTSVYVFVSLYILTTLAVTFFFRKKLNPRRAFAVRLWMLIWSLSAVIQFLNSDLLIVGFASAIGVLILFVIMENPEANLDRTLGCFNSYAMAQYISQVMQSQKTFSILDLTFEHADVFKEADQSVDDIMRQILHMVKPYKDILVFKKRNIGFIMISEQIQSLEVVGMDISSYLASMDSFHEGVTLILSDYVDSFENLDDLLRFLTYVRTEYASQDGQLFCVSDAIVMKYNEQHLIEIEIENALDQDRVEVFLQPIYSNRKKRFTSAEALARIRKETGGYLSPGIFIPIAEESGQILEIGERVFEKVCDFLEKTNVVELGIEYIEVNLSVIQCEQQNLAHRLLEIVKQYKIEPKLINLEITETASISARETLLKNMEILMEHGFTFSLDDFGKGESNLMYVVEMPVSIVKLDYDMTKAFFQSPKAQHVVRAVVKMAHDMNIKLVAEGIETEEEIGGMYREEIDYIQGYYYSKPLPMEEALEFFEAEQ